LRTFIYIDGFNLYYGSLKGTPYKWLDLKALFATLLGPAHQIFAIKYYTARITARPSDINAPIRQMVYFNALQAHIPEFYIKYGHFISKAVRMPLVTPIVFKKTVEVIKTEEKGSDVNLALHFLNDASHDLFDCGVLVSNDSDITEALRLVKKQYRKRIILCPPGDPNVRPVAIQLKRFADKTISIPTNVLAASQLPNNIPGTNINKPPNW